MSLLSPGSAHEPFLIGMSITFDSSYVARLLICIATGRCIYTEAPRLSKVLRIGCFLRRLLNPNRISELCVGASNPAGRY